MSSFVSASSLDAEDIKTMIAELPRADINILCQTMEYMLATRHTAETTETEQP